MDKITFSKIAFFLAVTLFLAGCGQPTPDEWFSYRNENRQALEVKVHSAEILAGVEDTTGVSKDTVRVVVEWKNIDDENVKVDDENFRLNVSGVKLSPTKFDYFELIPEQSNTYQYDFLVLKSFADKAKYKLSFEDWAEMPVTPVRK